jgi:hypothetical protein
MKTKNKLIITAVEGDREPQPRPKVEGSPLDILFAVAIVVLSLAVIGCEEEEQPVNDRAGKITGFLGNYSVTVKVMGPTLQAEWNDTANKIKAMLKTHFDNLVTLYGQQKVLDYYEEIFGRNIIYIVETNPSGYEKFKIIGDGKTVYIALNKVDTRSVSDGLEGAGEYETYQVKAIDSSRDTIRMAKAQYTPRVSHTFMTGTLKKYKSLS